MTDDDLRSLALGHPIRDRPDPTEPNPDRPEPGDARDWDDPTEPAYDPGIDGDAEPRYGRHAR